MSYKFLLFGTGVGTNYGCDAIVIGTPRILQHSFPDSEVWLPHGACRVPDYGNILGTNSGITVKSGLRDIRFSSLRKSICRRLGLFTPKILAVPQRLVKQADCILSIGGDLYTFANKEKDWPFPYSIVEAGNEIMRLGKPYVIWCASVGPLEKAESRLSEIVEHLKACRAIIVREHTSYSYLRDTLGLKDNVYLAADPAFLMEPVPFESSFLQKEKGNQILAINFSLAPVEHVCGNRSIDNLQHELALYVQQLMRDLPIKILFVPHVQKDHVFLEPVFNEISEKYPEKTWILPRNIGAQKTKWAISQANALLTMRFHCALAGFSTNTPTMVLVSTSKGAKICKEMYGNMEYSLNIADMNADILVSKIKRLLDNEDEIKKQIMPACKEMKRRALSAGSVLAEVL